MYSSGRTACTLSIPIRSAKALAPDDPDSMAYHAAQASDTVRRDPVARGVWFCNEHLHRHHQGAPARLLTEAW
jgi:hypothetical protein